MKIVTKEQQDAAATATMIGAAKGASLGLALFIPTFYLASRRFPSVARLPLVQRGFLGLIAGLGFGATNGELSYEKFIRDQHHDPSAQRLQAAEQHKQEEWVMMSPKERLLYWSAQHRYQLVAGSWLATMVGSAAFIFARNPTQTFSQKLVQCRMVAQGATVAVLIASAGLSQFNLDDVLDQQPESSWQQALEQPAQATPALGTQHTSHGHK